MSAQEKKDTIPLLARYIRPSEFLHFSESLYGSIKKTDLHGLISFEEILELTYTDTILEGEEAVVVPYLVNAKAWSSKNLARDKSHNPKSLKSKVRSEYRRLTRDYKTSAALPRGFAWHSENLDFAILNLLESIEDRNKNVVYSFAYKVIAKIIECILRHEIRNLMLPFDDQHFVEQQLDEKFQEKLKQLDAFKIESSFIKKRIQRLKSK